MAADRDVRTRVESLLHAVLLGLACFGVYANAYDHAFNLDSPHVIVSNPKVRELSPSRVWEYFTDPGTFTSLRSNVDYRPVLQVTYALDYKLGKYKMWPWHSTQVLLHFVCALGLYFLCRKILVRIDGVGRRAARWIALVAALVFALHPANSGVVDYVSARSSLLTAAFLFPSILLYMVPGESERYARARWLSAVLFGLALFTKVEAIACLAVYFLYDVWQTGAKNGHTTGFFTDLARTLRPDTLRRLWPALAIAVVYFVIRGNVMSEFEFEAARVTYDVGPLDYLRTQIVAWWYYLGRWFLAADLVADQAAFPVIRSVADPRLLVALGGWSVVAALLIGSWKRRPHLAFLTISALALISPTSSFVPLAEMVNEHRPFLPIAVLSLTWMIPLGLLARGLSAGNRAVQVVGGLGLVVLLVGLGRATFQRNLVFQTHESYWADVVEKAPSGRAHQNYGLTFMARGDFDKAMEHFQASVDLSPYWHVTHTNLGVLYAELGQPVKAKEHHDRAVDYDRFSGTALTWRGEFHLTRDRYAEALEDFQGSRPKSLEHYRNWKGRATAHAGLGNADECHGAFLRCLELDAGRAPMDIIAIATPFYDDPERYQPGVDFFQKLKVELPGAWWVHANISNLATRLGQTELAAAAWSRHLELKPKE